jgi:hypothetical protein
MVFDVAAIKTLAELIEIGDVVGFASVAPSVAAHSPASVHARSPTKFPLLVVPHRTGPAGKEVRGPRVISHEFPIDQVLQHSHLACLQLRLQCTVIG